MNDDHLARIPSFVPSIILAGDLAGISYMWRREQISRARMDRNIAERLLGKFQRKGDVVSGCNCLALVFLRVKIDTWS